MSDIRSNIKKQIEMLVKIEGSPKVFAEKVGATKQAVNNWLRGSNAPDIERIAEIAHAYDMSLSDFLEPDNESVEYEIIDFDTPEFSSQLMNLRKRAGYSNRDTFAEKIGVNKHTYRSWESGAAAMNAEQICMCAAALDCTPNDIVGWYEDHPGDLKRAHNYTDPRQKQLNACYESLNERSKTEVSNMVKSIAADPARRIEKEGEGREDLPGVEEIA